MNAQFLPLPISHKYEKKIFNDFYNNHPLHMDDARRELVKLLLQKKLNNNIPKLAHVIK